MARIPILESPGTLDTVRVQQTASLPAVTNGAIGQAIGEVGHELSDIAQKAARANDVAKLTEANIAMNQAQVDFAKYQQGQPDETQWVAKWEETVGKLKTSMDEMKLTSEARLQLSERLSDFGTRGTIMVQASAYKKTGQRMQDVGQLARLQAIESKDPSVYKNHLNMEVQAGFRTPESAAVEFKAVEEGVKTQKVSELRNQVPELTRLGNQGDLNAWVQLKGVYDDLRDLGALDDANYEIAQKQAEHGEMESVIRTRINGTDDLPVDLTRASKLTEDSDLPSGVKMELQADIARAKVRYANQDLLNFMDRAARGEVVDGSSFYSQFFSDAENAEARSKINEAIPPSPEQEARFYLDARAMIDGLDPALVKEDNPQEVVEFAKAALAIKKSPPHLRNQLSDALQAKLSGKEDKSLAADGAKLGREMLSEIVKSKEAAFYEGSGDKRILDPKKQGEWMKFQQKVFLMEQEINNRIKDATDIKKVNEIVSDVLNADYVEAKKQGYMAPSAQSGFEPMPQRKEGIDASLFPSVYYPGFIPP